MRNAIVLSLLIAGLLEAQDRARSPLDRVVNLKSIELTSGQQQQIERLRKDFDENLRDLQQNLNRVHTDEQRIARRKALQAARDAGKSNQEARASVDAAVGLTAEQQATIARLQKERNELLRRVQADILELLTPEQRQARSHSSNSSNPRDQPDIRPTHANVKYGPADRNVMDVWLAESEKPTPVLVSIHGGGFRSGNKKIDRRVLRECLDAGISAVAITYRLTNEAIAPAQMMDGARAIQFIRHNARSWNIDPNRIAATGGSAGAGISLWLGFHDDLADPGSDDPVLRESSRLTCMYVAGGQTSYDPRVIRDMFPGSHVHNHPALPQLYDIDPARLDELPKEKYELFELISPINHLSKDDPPVILKYGMALDAKPDIHHPLFGKLLKEKMDRLGIRCEVYAGREVLGGDRQLSVVEFLQQEFQTSR